MADLFNKIVRFVCSGDGAPKIELSLQGEFSWQAGVEPGITTAVIAFDDYDQIKDDPGREGTLEFWFSSRHQDGGQPDVKYEKMKIVEVEPFAIGVPAGEETYRTVLYRIAIADFRERWIWPRGGVLWKGELNKTPIVAATLLDKNGREMVSNEKLIGMCLEAMGYKVRYSGTGPQQTGEIVIPPNVNRTRPVTDLQWHGDHAPTELKKLLDEVGAVLCPRRDGTITINMVGAGNAIELPETRKIPETDCPGVDRRGKMVIITSAPNAILEETTFTGMDGGHAEWVNRGLDGVWKRLDQCEAMMGKTPEQWMRMEGISPASWEGAAIEGTVSCSLDDVRNRIWACLKLDASTFKLPILREIMHADKTSEPIKVSATRAVRDPATGNYSMRQHAPVDVAAILSGNILVLREQLWQTGTYPAAAYYSAQLEALIVQQAGRSIAAGLLAAYAGLAGLPFAEQAAKFLLLVDRETDYSVRCSLRQRIYTLEAEQAQAGQATNDPRYAREIDRTLLRITLSREVETPDGNPVPFTVGYQAGVNGVITRMDDAATSVALANPTGDVIIASHPQLRLYRTNDGMGGNPVEVNRAELEEAAEKLAANYLKGSNEGPREQRCLGFAAGGHLDGKLCEIRISQEPPLSVFKFMTWQLPRGNFLAKKGKVFDDGKAKSVPGGATQSDRSSAGASGYVQPAVITQTAPIIYPPAPAAPIDSFDVKLIVDGGANGTKTTACTWTYTVKSPSGVTLATAVAYTGPRPAVGKNVEAAERWGRARWVAGALVIIDAGEVAQRGDCDA